MAKQAILLCRSLRRFGGRYASSAVTALSPRKDRRPCRRDIEILGALGVDYVELDLVSPTPEYGPSFRVLALAWRAERSGSDILVQLDSDTVFLAEPDIRLGEAGVAARPVDATGMCSAGPKDRFEGIWRRMADLCDVDLDAIPLVSTTVDRRRVRASYNGGLIIGPRKLYPVVNEFLLRILHDRVRPFAWCRKGFQAGAGAVSRKGAQYWGTSQAAISMALAATGTPVRILGRDHNVPVHMLDDLPEPQLEPIHLHYHWMVDDGSFGRIFRHKKLRLSVDQKNWLAATVDRIWSGADGAEQSATNHDHDGAVRAHERW